MEMLPELLLDCLSQEPIMTMELNYLPRNMANPIIKSGKGYYEHFTRCHAVYLLMWPMIKEFLLITTDDDEKSEIKIHTAEEKNESILFDGLPIAVSTPIVPNKGKIALETERGKQQIPVKLKVHLSPNEQGKHDPS